MQCRIYYSVTQNGEYFSAIFNDEYIIILKLMATILMLNVLRFIKM